MAMKTRNVIQLVLTAVLFVVVVVLLIWGISTHTEPGLQEGVPTWPRAAFPLPVTASTYSAEGGGGLSDAHREAAEHTISVVNSRLGFDALTFVTGPGAIELQIGVPQDVSEGAPSEGFAPGEAIYNAGEYSRILHHGSEAQHCEVRTSNVPAGLLWQVLYHAFGHCLGLAHDDYTQSIMYPEQRQYEGLPPWFSDDDRELLREMYAPQD